MPVQPRFRRVSPRIQTWCLDQLLPRPREYRDRPHRLPPQAVLIGPDRIPGSRPWRTRTGRFCPGFLPRGTLADLMLRRERRSFRPVTVFCD